MTTTTPKLTADTLREAIHLAQIAQWRILEDLPEPVAFRTDLDTRELLEWIIDTAPSETFTSCRTCRQTILEWGNVVYPGADGTPISALFPPIEVEGEQHGEWMTWYQHLSTVLIRQRDGRPRALVSTLLRPTDGGGYPKALRGQRHEHLFVKYTPRNDLDPRTLNKLDAVCQQRTNRIMGMMGLSAEAASVALELHAQRYVLGDRCLHTLLYIHEIHAHADQAPDLITRRNIIFAACAQIDLYRTAPTVWLDALDDFAISRDLAALDGLTFKPITLGDTHE